MLEILAIASSVNFSYSVEGNIKEGEDGWPKLHSHGPAFTIIHSPCLYREGNFYREKTNTNYIFIQNELKQSNLIVVSILSLT